MNSTFTLPIAEDASDRKLLSDVRQYGWHIVAIDADSDGPQYVFTVGLFYSFKHPEIVIMGLDRAKAFVLLQIIVERIKAGTCFSDGCVDAELASFPVMFREVGLEHYETYLGYGIWFYRTSPRPFPAVQCVWPDSKGIFPWQDSYDRRFFTLQKQLY